MQNHLSLWERSREARVRVYLNHLSLWERSREARVRVTYGAGRLLG